MVYLKLEHNREQVELFFTNPNCIPKDLWHKILFTNPIVMLANPWDRNQIEEMRIVAAILLNEAKTADEFIQKFDDFFSNVYPEIMLSIHKK